MTTATMPALPDQAARLRTILENQRADRADLNRKLQTIALAGGDDDALARQIEEADRDIARTALRLEAAENAAATLKAADAAKTQDKARKAAEKALRTYEDRLLAFEALALSLTAEWDGVEKSFQSFLAIATPEQRAHMERGTMTAHKPRTAWAFIWAHARQHWPYELPKPLHASGTAQRLADRLGIKRPGILPWLNLK